MMKKLCAMLTALLLCALCLGLPANAAAEEVFYTVTYHVYESYTKTEDVLKDKIAEAFTPTQTGYAFGGWYKDEALTQPWDPEDEPIVSDIHVYARWIRAYHLYVGGDQVHDEKLSGPGWRYTPGSNTLTLDGADIKGKIIPYEEYAEHSGMGIYYVGDGSETLNLVVNSDSKVTAEFTEQNQCYALNVLMANLKITGNGKLTANAAVTDLTQQEGGYAIHLAGGGTLTIDGVEIEAEAGNTVGRLIYSGAIFNSEDIVIKNGAVVTAKINRNEDGEHGGVADVTGAIYSESGSIIIEDSTVKAYAGNGPSVSAGIGTGNGDITITNSTVTGVGGTSDGPSYGIGAGNTLIIQGSTVTAKGGSGSSSYGLGARDGWLTITDYDPEPENGDDQDKIISRVEAIGGNAVYDSYGIGASMLDWDEEKDSDNEKPWKLVISGNSVVTAIGGTVSDNAIEDSSLENGLYYPASYGIGATKSMTIENAEVTAKGGKGLLSYGIGSEEAIEFIDENLTDDKYTIVEAEGGTMAIGSRTGEITWLPSPYIYTVKGGGDVTRRMLPAIDYYYLYTYVAMGPGYPITYDLAGGELEEGAVNPAVYSQFFDPISLNNPVRDGYTFDGWTGTGLSGKTQAVTIPTGSKGSRTYTANWMGIPKPVYTVTVTAEGNGTASAAPASGETGTEVTLSESANEGWRFKEWQVVSGGVTIADNKFEIGTENVEIKAIFEEIPKPVYTVTVTVEGNGTASAAPASGETGTEVTLSESANEGWRFKEWQIVSGGVTIADNKFEIGTANVEIKAVFEEIPKPVYTVKVTAEGNGTASASVESGVEGTEVTLSEAAGEGWKFKEWQIVAGGVEIVDNKFEIGTANVEIKAVFEETSKPVYTVTVTAEGNGEASASVESGEMGTEVTLSAAANEGWQFKEWQVVAGGVEIVDNRFEIGTANVEIKAVFEEIPVEKTFTVSFDGNGGTGEMAAITGVTGDIALPENAFTAPEGMQFRSWSIDGAEYAPSASITVTQDIVVKAEWEAIPEVGQPPEIILPTEDTQVTSAVGMNQTLTVEAINADTYQWYINRNDGKGYVELEGATEPSYTTSAIKAENNGFTYICVARNAYGEDTSPVFTIVLLEAAALPQTGDHSDLNLWLMLALDSCLGAAALARSGRKRSME